MTAGTRGSAQGKPSFCTFGQVHKTIENHLRYPADDITGAHLVVMICI